MKSSALIMFVFMCGVIWGGFILTLAKAIRNEKKKGKGAE